MDRQPAVSRSSYAYNWLVSWHIWGVRIRTGKLPWQWGMAKPPCSEHAMKVITARQNRFKQKVLSKAPDYPNLQS